jgi:hypothetical protein
MQWQRKKKELQFCMCNVVVLYAIHEVVMVRAKAFFGSASLRWKNFSRFFLLCPSENHIVSVAFVSHRIWNIDVGFVWVDGLYKYNLRAFDANSVVVCVSEMHILGVHKKNIENEKLCAM